MTSTPAHCPGPESQGAGSQAACAGCPSQSICASANSPQAKAEAAVTSAAIAQRLSTIQHVLLVLSGKGGVGKSTFATNLAFALASTCSSSSSRTNGASTPTASPTEEDLSKPMQVGLLDIDITGPSLPIMTGTEGEPVHASASGWCPIYIQDNLSVMSVGLLLPSADDALIWRGPRKNGMITQFLRDVDWGEEGLDVLVIDTPPGTSDEHLSIVSHIRGTGSPSSAVSGGISGAVLISTPQEIALQDVRREVTFCRKVGIPIAGLVENMTAFVCPKCSTATDIFAPSSTPATTTTPTVSAVRQFCLDENIPFLGSIPLDPRIGMAADSGSNFCQEWPDTPAALAYHDIVKGVKRYLSSIPSKT